MQQAIASSIRLQLAWIAVGRFVRSTSCVPIVYMLVIIIMRAELSSQQSQSLVFTVISIRQTIRTFNHGVVVPLSQSARAGTTATLYAEEPKPVWWHRQSMRPHCDSHHSSFLCFSLSDAECWSVCRGQPKFGALTLWLYFNDVVDSHVVTNGGNGIIDLSVETKLKVSSRQ